MKKCDAVGAISSINQTAMLSSHLWSLFSIVAYHFLGDRIYVAFLHQLTSGFSQFRWVESPGCDDMSPSLSEIHMIVG